MPAITTRRWQLYQRALAIDPNSAQAHYNLGLAFAETKVFKEAVVEWQKVVASTPTAIWDRPRPTTSASSVSIGKRTP